jgi:hypothetical protein
MIFTGYLDESGTHADSEISAMAGFVSNARQWRKYEKRTARLFQRYGVKTFHAIDVRRGDGDFAGWKVDRKIEFLDEFQHVINETLESGVVAFIRRDDYQYYLNLNWPQKVRWDSKYTLMFRGCLSEMVDVIGHIPHETEPHLHIVLEDGHTNADDAVRNYQWVRDRSPHAKRALAGITFADKNCLPLAAADYFAYIALRDKLGLPWLGVARKPTKSDLSYRNNMCWVDLNRDSLDGLHEQAIRIAYGGPASLLRLPH